MGAKNKVVLYIFVYLVQYLQFVSGALKWPQNLAGLKLVPGENFTAQSLLLYGYGAVKELNESSHFSVIVVFFGLKHFSFVSSKIP